MRGFRALSTPWIAASVLLALCTCALAEAPSAGEALPPAEALPVGEATEAPLLDGRLTDAAWTSARTLELPMGEGLPPSIVELVVHDGGLFVGYRCLVPYQRTHSLSIIVLAAGDHAAGGLRLHWTPWSIQSPPYAVEKKTGEDGEWHPAEGKVAGAAAFAPEGWSGGWSGELLLTGDVFAGSDELRVGIQARTELGPASVPADLDAEDPQTYLLFAFAPPLAPGRLLAGSESLSALIASETDRNREIAELMRVAGMLNAVRDMQGIARVYTRLLELSPECPDYRISLAAQLALTGRIRESAEMIVELRDQFRGYVGVPSDEMLAHSLLQAHLWDRARAALAELPEDNQRRNIDEAMLAYHLGDFARGLGLTNALLERDDIPPERAKLIRDFHDYCAEYAGGLLAEELEYRRQDAAGEPLPVAVLVLEGGAEVELELFENDAPNTVANFIQLAEQGFYDGTRFHRIVSTGLVQGGCPLTRNAIARDDGLGGPPYRIATELGTLPGQRARRHFRGSLGMANTGEANTEGSQFYVCVSTCAHLNDRQTVFGRVLSGQEHVDAIQPYTVLERVEIRRKRDHPYEVQKLPL